MSEILASLSGFEKILFYIAVPFTLLTIIQLILEIIGLGGHHADAGMGDTTGGVDVTADHMPSFNVFTVRNVIYFLTMFGWTGLAASKAGAPVWLTTIIAIIAGTFTSFIIGYIFYLLSKLTESGNIKLANAVGSFGSVYLPIPARRVGSGIIQITVQGMTIEVKAITDGDDNLKTGTPIKVMNVIDDTTVLVSKSEA